MRKEKEKQKNETITTSLKEDKFKAELNSEKLKKRERAIRIIKIGILIIALFLMIIYFLLVLLEQLLI